MYFRALVLIIVIPIQALPYWVVATIQSDMDPKSDTNFPRWVLSPAKYSAPPTEPGDTMDKEKVVALVQACAEKGLVLLSIIQAQQCKTFSQLSNLYFAQPCSFIQLQIV